MPGYHILAAVEGGEVLSSCTLLIVPNLTHGGRPYGVVENVVTHPTIGAGALPPPVLILPRSWPKSSAAIS